MPVAKRAETMPVEALKQLLIDPVPGLAEGYLIGRTALAHVGVAPEMYRGEIEVRDGRPLRGQDHQIDLRRSYGQEYPQLDDSDPVFLPYATVEISPKRAEDRIYLEKLGAARMIDRLSHNLLLARRSMLLVEEEMIADLLFTAANWSANTSSLVALTGGSGVKFGGTGAKEFSDISRASERASASFDNMAPTDVAIGYSAFKALRRAVETKSNVNTNIGNVVLADQLTIDLIKNASGAERVHVGRARHETARAGATSVISDIWTDSMAFYWRDVVTGPSVNGITSNGGTAVGIYLDSPGAVEGYRVEEIDSRDPPTISMMASVERTQIFLGETDGSTGAVLAPRGFLLSDLV